MSKTITKSIFITLIYLLLLTAGIIVVMTFWFPSNLAGICYNMGLNKASANLYYKDYEKNDNALSLYKSLNLDIKLDNHLEVITKFEEFKQHKDYQKILTAVVNNSKKASASSLVISSLLNEENYLSCCYANALIKTNQTSEALNFALASFAEHDSITKSDIGIYVWSELSIITYSSNFTITYSDFGYTQSIYEEITNYFNNLYALYNNSEIVGDEYEIALANRIINVGENIKTIKRLISDISSNDDINNILIDVNNGIKEILGCD